MGTCYDIVILGAGAAGLTAGIYAGRSRLRTLIIDKDKPGGQIRITSEVANYPGVLRTSGEALGGIMRQQAKSFGAEFLDAEVLSVDFSGSVKKIVTTEKEVDALSVVIATGAVPRKIGFKGEDDYRGRGIGYCATCDGEFFTGMDVFVIGAGFAAAEESIFLTRYARKVTIIAREPAFTCAPSIAEKVLANPKIEVKFHTEIQEVGGDAVLKYARFIDNRTGEAWEYRVSGGDSTFGVFVFVGYVPQSGLFAEQVERDRMGYIPTDDQLMTNAAGVFAAGDVRPKALRQLVTAVSDGAVAATSAERYVGELKQQLGLPETELREESGQREKNPETGRAGAADFFDDDLKAQLTSILSRLENPVRLQVFLEEGVDWENELVGFTKMFAALSDKVSLEFFRRGESLEKEQAAHVTIFPSIALLYGDGRYTGVQFHGVPGGHEINSFVLALYNAAGPGQKLAEETLEAIRSIKQQVLFKIGVSLSCTLCPDVVAATQLMALRSPLIESEMIDVARYPDFKNKYAIMSVPAILMDDRPIVFGKKSLDDLIAMASDGNEA